MGHVASFIRLVFVEPSYFLTNGNGHKNKTQTGSLSDLTFVLDAEPPCEPKQIKIPPKALF